MGDSPAPEGEPGSASAHDFKPGDRALLDVEIRRHEDDGTVLVRQKSIASGGFNYFPVHPSQLTKPNPESERLVPRR